MQPHTVLVMCWAGPGSKGRAWAGLLWAWAGLGLARAWARALGYNK